MRNTFLLFILASFFVSSCADEQFKDFDKTPSGLNYKITSGGNDTGITAVDGDIVSIYLDYRTADDSVFYTNFDKQPFEIHMRESEYTGDIYEGLKLMHVGDSATFVTSVDSFFTKIQASGIPDFLDTGSFFYIDVKMMNILTKEQQEAERQRNLAELQAKEQPLIDKYLHDNDINVEPDSNGVYFISVKKGKGKNLVAGYYAKLNLKIEKLDDKNVLYDSQMSSNGDGIDYLVGSGYFGLGFDLSLTNAKVGEKYKLLVPSKMAFGARGAEGIVPPYTPLFYTVEVLDTYSEDELNARRKKEYEEARANEENEIKAYVKSHGITVSPDADGIYKQILSPGTGEDVRVGDKVKVNYTGYLLDGKKFDSSKDPGREPFEFIVGAGKVIPGWDKGVSTMKVGEKAVFVIPSALAYGPQGSSGVIPPNAPLVFEVELLEIVGK